ncbi:lyase [Aliidiomarina haloalkalitolerans]|uniref:Lyase n=1 Tax=Aliidiomarina haloalkalitolerans TaxID=859059 RepID=A0A432VVW3_9GAMM|nr:lyase [Aliidiomarina haloalkalitolerans]RUO20698.1 lyase [Aliidiomarina haloalkalitolerans]
MLHKLLMTSIFAAGLVTLPVVADHHSANTVKLDIEEWEVPYEGPRSRDPWVGGPDQIWFVGQRTHYVGMLTPSTGEFKKYDLDDGAGPHTVISDHRGAWYAGNRASHLGFLDPETGEISKYYPPGDGPRDVHTMDWDSLGNIWFTEQGGNRIGYFDTESEQFTMYEVTTPRARPYGIIVVNDQPWAVTLGTNQLLTVIDNELVEIDLPREVTRSRRLAADSVGNIWFADYAAGYIGQYNPVTGEVAEWQAPSLDRSRPYAVAMDSDDRFWIVETGVQPNLFVAFDTRNQTWSEQFSVPSGAGTVRHMVYDEDSNSIWFGTDMNTIGQARIKTE